MERAFTFLLGGCGARQIAAEQKVLQKICCLSKKKNRCVIIFQISSLLIYVYIDLMHWCDVYTIDSEVGMIMYIQRFGLPDLVNRYVN